jgi:YHS domain-containing protein
MKKMRVLFLITGLVLMSGLVHAASQDGMMINNKICPISGEDVGKKPAYVEHDGKTYQLCCAMCVKDFNKDPEKYIKMIESQTEEK